MEQGERGDKRPVGLGREHNPYVTLENPHGGKASMARAGPGFDSVVPRPQSIPRSKCSPGTSKTQCTPKAWWKTDAPEVPLKGWAKLEASPPGKTR